MQFVLQVTTEELRKFSNAPKTEFNLEKELEVAMQVDHASRDAPQRLGAKVDIEHWEQKRVPR